MILSSSLDLYPASVHTNNGLLSPEEQYGSEIDDTCKLIRKACKGMGTDTKLLLKEMGSLGPRERCLVPARYRELYDGKDLRRVIQKERQCGGDFGTALELLALDPVAAECALLDQACHGAGTDELLVCSILCGRSNPEMEILKKKYFEIYASDLGRRLDAELSGDLINLMFHCLQAGEESYDPDEYHTESQVLDDAESLYHMGPARLGTDENGIFRILCQRPPAHLERVNQVYSEKYGHPLSAALEREFSGHVQKAVLFLLGMKLEPYHQVARLIKAACRGFGTNELLLTSTLIRYQCVLRKVMPVHYELFQKTVRDRVNSETSGDYRRLLLEIIETAEHV